MQQQRHDRANIDGDRKRQWRNYREEQSCAHAKPGPELEPVFMTPTPAHPYPNSCSSSGEWREDRLPGLEDNARRNGQCRET